MGEKGINIMAVLREVLADVVDEYRDDKKLTGAEVVETLGLLSQRLAEEPGLADWAGPLELAGRELVELALKMGEDGQ